MLASTQRVTSFASFRLALSSAFAFRSTSPSNRAACARLSSSPAERAILLRYTKAGVRVGRNEINSTRNKCHKLYTEATPCRETTVLKGGRRRYGCRLERTALVAHVAPRRCRWCTHPPPRTLNKRNIASPGSTTAWLHVGAALRPIFFFMVQREPKESNMGAKGEEPAQGSSAIYREDGEFRSKHHFRTIDIL